MITDIIDNYLENPKVVFEIGVGRSIQSRSRKYWNTAKCYLFEPLKSFYDDIKQNTIKYENVFVYNVAIYDKSENLVFLVSDEESSILGLNSPLAQQNFLPLSNIPPKETVVESKMITDFDKGDIDLLLLDMEGAEYFVLKHLISRPKVIVVEMEIENSAFLNGRYKNPYSDEINDWMKNNNYHSFFKNGADVYWTR